MGHVTQMPKSSKYTDPKYVTASHSKALAAIHPATLRNWAIRGQLDHIITPSGKRIYNKADVYRLMGLERQHESSKNRRRKVIYARVSSAHQKADLDRQISTLNSQFPEYEVIQDIGSGLNFKRKGFEHLLVGIHEGTIEEIVVTYRDRLCRFGFDLFAWLLKKHEVKLVVLDTVSEQNSPNGFNELAEDLLAITNYFVAKNNGLRAGKARAARQRKQKETTEYQGESGEASEDITPPNFVSAE